MSLQYTFTDKSKRLTYILMLLGVIGLAYGFYEGAHHGGHYNRVWANILVNGFFFLSIALCGVFFIAVNSVAEAAWWVTSKRIFESVMKFLPIGAGIVIIVLIAGYFHAHHIWHWMDSHVYDPTHEDYDAIIDGKGAYFNPMFFWSRVIIFLGGYWMAARLFRKRSLLEDAEGGGTKWYWKNFAFAGGFLVFFGFTSSVLSWDLLMSIDTHWFSTMFGWYVFSGLWIAGLCTFNLLAIHLKKRGHLQNVNENHLHDLGKWMFAIALLWCYLWFCQYMLYWYSNIPEEVTYFQVRFEQHRVLLVTMFFVNFLIPMLLLMSRDSKRNGLFLTVGAIVLLIFHWLDVYQIVMPGATKEEGFCLSWWEVVTMLGFLGLFLNVTLRELTKAPLQVQNHVFLEESIHHEV